MMNIRNEKQSSSSSSSSDRSHEDKDQRFAASNRLDGTVDDLKESFNLTHSHLTLNHISTFKQVANNVKPRNDHILLRII